MNAREKLNIAYVNGSLVIAAVAGGLTGSGVVFGVTLAILIALNVGMNNLRPRK